MAVNGNDNENFKKQILYVHIDDHEQREIYTFENDNLHITITVRLQNCLVSHGGILLSQTTSAVQCTAMHHITLTYTDNIL
jgi:hypothetical protein